MRNKKARALVEESVERGEYCYCLEPMQFLFYTTSFENDSSVFLDFVVVVFSCTQGTVVTFKLPHGNVEQTDRVSFCFLIGESERQGGGWNQPIL